MKNCRVALFLGALCLAYLQPGRAAILSDVPMQGTMVMPMIRYDAANSRLRVMVESTVPRLTPLLVSHPGDRFDPADPWYSALDPQAEGMAFSRRYGFVMDTMSDPLPSGAVIVLRRLAGSSDLQMYRYRSSVPKVWEPIFGTDGSSESVPWDGMMFHPCVVAPAGANSYSATFEAVLMDTLSGKDMPGTSTGPFELNWTNVPDGRPSLEISYKVAIVCPAGAGWTLETAETLRPAAWMAVTNSPVILDGQSSVVLEASAARKFYRMRRQP